MSYYSVLHWSALTREKQEIIDLQGRVAPCEVQGFTSRRLFQLGIFLQGVVFGVWFFFFATNLFSLCFDFRNTREISLRVFLELKSVLWQ
jgi:hypothetical protein